MNLSYSAEHEAFRAEVRAFIAAHAHLKPRVDPMRRPSPDVLAWQKLRIDNGYAARTIPKEYRGYGAEPDILKSRIIAEEFAAARIPPGISNQGIAMLVPTLLELGSEEQRRQWIAPTLRGEVVWCQGYSEPEAGSDLASLRTHAVEDGDDFLVSGQKIWTSTAQEADMIFCLVRTERDAPKHEGISYLLFSMRTPGIDVRPLKTMTGEAEFNEVFFDKVRVPKTQIVGARGQGWLVANATLTHERGQLADPNAFDSRLQRLFDLAREETVDGRRIIDDPATCDRLMRLQARVLAVQLSGLRLLTASAKGQDARLARLVAKLEGCDLKHEMDAFAIDALGELGLLYDGSPRVRAHGAWQTRTCWTWGSSSAAARRRFRRTSLPSADWACRANPSSRRGEPMDFSLSEEQLQLQDSVDRMLGRHCPLDRVRRFADSGELVARDVWQGLIDLGLAGMVIPEAHGGLGLQILDAALVAEMLGRHVAPVPFTASSVMAPLALMGAGSPAQQREWLPRLAGGEIVAGVGIAEATSGARDSAGVVVSGGRLNGISLFVMDHADADIFIVADRAGGLRIVDGRARGLVRIPLTTIDITRPVCKLRFEDTPAEGLSGDAAAALARMRDAGRVLLAADTLGAAWRMIEMAVDYAKQRKQFGRVIGSFQAVKHMCAEMAAQLEPGRSLVWYAGYAQDHAPERGPMIASHAKAHLSEVGKFVARTATEVHGGMGITDLLGLHYWFKRIGANRQLLGSPERLRAEAARAESHDPEYRIVASSP